MDNRHKAVWDWLQGCPHIQDLFFNAARADEGKTMLVPSERLIEAYIDGSSLRSYDCALNRYTPISFDPNDLANLQDAVDMDELGAWIEEQNENGNFPAFPEGQRVQEITLSPNESGWMAMMEAGLAKYMIQFQIEYTKG